MPTKTFRTIAKKSDKSVGDMERYWERATRSYQRQQAKARAGRRKPIKDKHAYIMATTLRQAQRTGAHPHTPLGTARRKKASKEGFASRVDAILESS